MAMPMRKMTMVRFSIFMPVVWLNSKLYFFREMYVEIPMINIKERKDEVGGSQAVPFCMSQGGIDMSPRTGVVYHNHTCDGDTTKNVECKDAFAYFVLFIVIFVC